jgi:AcrR family transcriptional regulator
MAKKHGYHHGDLRVTLVEAARHLVEQKGPERLTMSDACRAAGVSTAAPYRHFADMDEILLAVAHDGMARHREAMETAGAAHPLGSDAAVAAIGLAYIAFARSEPGVFRLTFALTRTHKGQPDLIADGRATFGVVLSQIAARLGLPPEDPRILDRGLKLWAFVHGLSFLIIDEKAAAMGLTLDLAAMLTDVSRRILVDPA